MSWPSGLDVVGSLEALVDELDAADAPPPSRSPVVRSQFQAR